ncbi:acetyl-coenzyme A synthetase 2-like, mitochondrial isoform X2 [Heterodontus francisci]|uniref:acetyl-coenzyme A synthetase 2-like, mitochondrial isoform X2 n=1 Tax=Heterodontus francisci TaxID=7792 RepID=UPI00355C6FC3
MATIVAGQRLLQIPFKRCLLPGACVKSKAAARGLEPKRIRPFHVTPPAANMPEASSFPGVRSYAELMDLSIGDPDKFWGTLAKETLVWNQLFHRVHDCDLSKGFIAWFLGGQLNVSVNCLDRHANQFPNRVALIWERDEPGTELKITYRELLETTCRLANTMKRHGVQKGDRVAIYLPVSPLGIAAMLACARIGAVHTVIFAGFSSQALGGRIRDAQRTDKKVPMGNTDIPLEEEMEKEQPVCDPESMDSEDLLFLLYTSGSTGKPKGLVHTQAGYLLYASLTHKYVFDYQEGDIHCCVADIGWITGHSYVVYGPLCNGGTTVLFESTPIYPDPGRYWETVQRLRINQFYGAPTAIRLLLNYGDSWVSKYDRSSLKMLGTVGEPINHEAWKWFWKVVGDGRCTLVDTWWQTETGGICISPRPSEKGAKILPAMAMRPFFGIQPALMDEKGNRLEGNDVTGALCITKPWPGIARTIYGDHPRFLNSYFEKYPGCYFTGDGAHRSEEGYYQITGRMDDIINIGGHRLGTAEIEDALAEHPDVPETAVIGYPHDLKGEAAFAFVVLKDTRTISEPVIIKDLKSTVASKIAKYAVPDQILIVKRLPKTRSGKIMRRVLKKIAIDETSNLGDLSTLDDPQVITEIIATYKKYKKDPATSQ